MADLQRADITGMGSGSVTTGDDSTVAPELTGSMLDWFRSTAGGWAGPREAHANQEIEEELLTERSAAGPMGLQMPWFLPFFDQGQNLNENQAMRQAYRIMLSDPNVKAAFLGKVLAVGALDLKVIPATRKDPEDAAVAEFVRFNLEEALEGGVPGLIWSVVSGGLIDGYSVCEKVWEYEDQGEYAGKYVLRKVKPKDTGQDIVLKTDPFRNVTKIQGLRYNAGKEFDPAHFLIFRHLPLWDQPTGQSDFRAAYQPWWMLDTVKKLWAQGLDKNSMPILVGQYARAQQKPSLANALARLKSRNWLAIPADVQVTALEIAGSSLAAFDAACMRFKHEIFLAIQGAILQSLEGTTTEGRGDSSVHRATADLLIWYLATTIEALLNDRRHGVVRDMVDMNYAVPRYPRISLSAVDYQDVLAQMGVRQTLYEIGMSQSRGEIYDAANISPPDPDDPLDSLGSKADQEAQVAASAQANAVMQSPGAAGLADEQVVDTAPGQGVTRHVGPGGAELPAANIASAMMPGQVGAPGMAPGGVVQMDEDDPPGHPPAPDPPSGGRGGGGGGSAPGGPAPPRSPDTPDTEVHLALQTPAQQLAHTIRAAAHGFPEEHPKHVTALQHNQAGWHDRDSDPVTSALWQQVQHMAGRGMLAISHDWPHGVVVGHPDKVNEMVGLLGDFGRSRGMSPGQYARRMGQLFGYPADSIEEHVRTHYPEDMAEDREDRVGGPTSTGVVVDRHNPPRQMFFVAGKQVAKPTPAQLAMWMHRKFSATHAAMAEVGKQLGLDPEALRAAAFAEADKLGAKFAEGDQPPSYLVHYQSYNPRSNTQASGGYINQHGGMYHYMYPDQPPGASSPEPNSVTQSRAAAGSYTREQAQAHAVRWQDDFAGYWPHLTHHFTLEPDDRSQQPAAPATQMAEGDDPEAMSRLRQAYRVALIGLVTPKFAEEPGLESFAPRRRQIPVRTVQPPPPFDISEPFIPPGPAHSSTGHYGAAGARSPGLVTWPFEHLPFELRDLIHHDEAMQFRRMQPGRMMQFFNSLPPDEQYIAAAYAGAAKRNWYHDTVTMLAHMIPDPELRHRYTGMIAATSPRNPVRDNLLGATRAFTMWMNAGKPNDPDKIMDLLGIPNFRLLSQQRGEDVSGRWTNINKRRKAWERFDKGLAEQPTVPRVTQADTDWVNSWMPTNKVGNGFIPTSHGPNVVRALSGYRDDPDDPNSPWIDMYHPVHGLNPQFRMGGDKVNSFMLNLLGHMGHSTNDVWMAYFGGIPHDALGKIGPYFLYTAKMRRVANQMGWHPAEVQAAIWSYYRELARLQLAPKGVQPRTPEEALRAIRHEGVRGTADYGTILAYDPEIHHDADQSGDAGARWLHDGLRRIAGLFGSSRSRLGAARGTPEGFLSGQIFPGVQTHPSGVLEVGPPGSWEHHLATATSAGARAGSVEDPGWPEVVLPGVHGRGQILKGTGVVSPTYLGPAPPPPPPGGKPKPRPEHGYEPLEDFAEDISATPTSPRYPGITVRHPLEHAMLSALAGVNLDNGPQTPDIDYHTNALADLYEDNPHHQPNWEIHDWRTKINKPATSESIRALLNHHHDRTNLVYMARRALSAEMHNLIGPVTNRRTMGYLTSSMIDDKWAPKLPVGDPIAERTADHITRFHQTQRRRHLDEHEAGIPPMFPEIRRFLLQHETPPIQWVDQQPQQYDEGNPPQSAEVPDVGHPPLTAAVHATGLPYHVRDGGQSFQRYDIDTPSRRRITLHYHPTKNIAEIDFVHHDRPSDNEGVMPAGVDPDLHSFVGHIRGLVSQLHSQQIPLAFYPSTPKRARLYARALGSAGYQHTFSLPGGYQLWHPIAQPDTADDHAELVRLAEADYREFTEQRRRQPSRAQQYDEGHPAQQGRPVQVTTGPQGFGNFVGHYVRPDPVHDGWHIVQHPDHGAVWVRAGEMSRPIQPPQQPQQYDEVNLLTVPPGGGRRRPFGPFAEGVTPGIPSTPTIPGLPSAPSVPQSVVMHSRLYQPVLSHPEGDVHIAQGVQHPGEVDHYRMEASNQHGHLVATGPWTPQLEDAHAHAMDYHAKLGGDPSQTRDRSSEPITWIGYNDLARRDIDSLSLADLHHLSGAPSDAVVSKASPAAVAHDPGKRTPDGQRSIPQGAWYPEDVPQNWYTRKFEVQHPFFTDRFHLKMTAGADFEGKKLLHLSGIETSRHAPPGYGLHLVATIASRAMHHGFNYIAMHAAGDSDRALEDHEEANGYTTWAKGGFNEDIDSLMRNMGPNNNSVEAATRVRHTFGNNVDSVLDIIEMPHVDGYLRGQSGYADDPNATRLRLQQLDHNLSLSLQEKGRPPLRSQDYQRISGEDWWRAWGGDMYDAKFDLTPGSQSHRVLARKLARAATTR